MRHRNSGKKLSRTSSHRKALFLNMTRALLLHGRIKTTVTKAKVLQGVVEPLITLALEDTLHARRQAFAFLRDHALVKQLFDEIAPQFANKNGGYTRVVKLAHLRKGDAAPMALIELITEKAPVSSEE